MSYGCGENAKKQPPSADATKPADKGVKASQNALPEPQVSKLTPNPEAEREVDKKVKAGKTADLKELFPNKADRVLRASFLEGLLLRSPAGGRRHKLVGYRHHIVNQF